jgi:hypothetical protein
LWCRCWWIKHGRFLSRSDRRKRECALFSISDFLVGPS